METWRKIPGLPHHEVSDRGRVRLLPHSRAYTRNGRWTFSVTVHVEGRVLKPCDDGRYLSVSIGRKKYLVHRLVLMAFARLPIGDEQCRHRNGKSKDNRPKNLLWGTGTENQFDRFDHGTACAGEDSYRAILTEKDVRQIMLLRSAGNGPKAIADALCLERSHVKHVIYGQAWNWLTELPRNRHGKTTRPAAVAAVNRHFDVLD